MIVILLGWLASANCLLFLPSWGLQIYPLPEEDYAELEEMTLFRFYLEIKLLQPFEHEFNAVQHFIYAGSKYTDVI